MATTLFRTESIFMCTYFGVALNLYVQSNPKEMNDREHRIELFIFCIVKFTHCSTRLDTNAHIHCTSKRYGFVFTNTAKSISSFFTSPFGDFKTRIQRVSCWKRKQINETHSRAQLTPTHLNNVQQQQRAAASFPHV